MPDDTPLNTSPGFTWEQYRLFCGMWKNEDGISVCHLCKMPEIAASNSDSSLVEYQIDGDSVVPVFNAQSKIKIWNCLLTIIHTG